MSSFSAVAARFRAKKTLTAAGVPFYLVFTEGYAATAGDRWVRPDLADEAIRLGRVVSGLLPREPEALALLALREFQRSRFAARETASGGAVLRADAVAAARGLGRGPYALQAEITQCHAVAPSVAETDWGRIVLLCEILGRVAPSPVVELNRAGAVSMAVGPAEALAIVDEVEHAGALRGSRVVPSVRGSCWRSWGGCRRRGPSCWRQRNSRRTRCSRRCCARRRRGSARSRSARSGAWHSPGARTRTASWRAR